MTIELLLRGHVPGHPLPDGYLWAKVWSVKDQKQYETLGIYDLVQERVELTDIPLDRFVVPE